MTFTKKTYEGAQYELILPFFRQSAMSKKIWALSKPNSMDLYLSSIRNIRIFSEWQTIYLELTYLGGKVKTEINSNSKIYVTEAKDGLGMVDG